MSDDSIEFGKELKVTETAISGLLVIDIPVHGDSRGWFKENWQRKKMVSLGLPDFRPVQNNISFNASKGVTRGIHAEPWDKYVSVGYGRIYGAWVDLREGETFGKVFTTEVDSSKAIFVPRGVGNSFQALEDNTVYTYLVNEHWSADLQSKYAMSNLADPTLAIQWPIALEDAIISDKDKITPLLAETTPMKPLGVMIIGGDGQLGRALQPLFPGATVTDKDTLDITDDTALSAVEWGNYSTIINASGFTAVDAAETAEGRKLAWEINAKAVGRMARIAQENNLTFVHVSSDYVFDGSLETHTEEEGFSPLGVYAQTKAAGDIAAQTAPRHYILRTSWVIGEGKNFARTMRELAAKGVKPAVVNDQIGRPTLTADLAGAVAHLLNSRAQFGTYNVTNDGESVSWMAIAKFVYEKTGYNPDDVTGVSTEEYFRGKESISPRPLNSTLTLDKIKATGFYPRPWSEALEEYLQKESA